MGFLRSHLNNMFPLSMDHIVALRMVDAAYSDISAPNMIDSTVSTNFITPICQKACQFVHFIA